MFTRPTIPPTCPSYHPQPYQPFSNPSRNHANSPGRTYRTHLDLHLPLDRLRSSIHPPQALHLQRMLCGVPVFEASFEGMPRVEGSGQRARGGTGTQSVADDGGRWSGDVGARDLGCVPGGGDEAERLRDGGVSDELHRAHRRTHHGALSSWRR